MAMKLNDDELENVSGGVFSDVANAWYEKHIETIQERLEAIYEPESNEIIDICGKLLLMACDSKTYSIQDIKNYLTSKKIDCSDLF